MGTLEERLTAVESSLRRWRLISVVSIGALVAALSLGQAKPASPSDLVANKITARQIAIVDEKGVARVSLNGFHEASGITLYDQKGVYRGGFSTPNDLDILLDLRSTDGKDAVDFNVTTGIGATVTLKSSDGEYLTMSASSLKAKKNDEQIFKLP